MLFQSMMSLTVTLTTKVVILSVTTFPFIGISINRKLWL